MTTATAGGGRKYLDGRDELNLADFPISVLQRQQPTDGQGAKKDTAVFQATRYDRQARQRVQQKVILEATSRHGLPTPADENVVLALLYVAKHSHNFAEPVVRFAPRQLFDIMGWAPNSRSYDRLRKVLRRLKALVIRYENSWWDIAGRSYEAEVATGIISEYELGRQVGGRAGAAVPPCWVCWTPHFQRSLSNGNLKKLDLERLFALRLPTSQRLYRFLDKRFYPPQQPPEVDLDLHDFAFGHIGLSRVENVAELKRRLAPAIGELEAIGFLARADPKERFYKVKAGVWRVRFKAGPDFLARAGGAPAETKLPAPPEPVVEDKAAAVAPPEPSAEEAEVIAAFYRSWRPGERPAVGEADRGQARELVGRLGAAKLLAVLPDLVRILKKEWPACKSFSGAVGKYLSDALRAWERRQRQQEATVRAKATGQAASAEAAQSAEERRRLEAEWQALSDERRAEIERAVLARHPELAKYRGILKMFCLTELEKTSAAAPPADADGSLFHGLR